MSNHHRGWEGRNQARADERNDDDGTMPSLLRGVRTRTDFGTVSLPPSERRTQSARRAWPDTFVTSWRTDNAPRVPSVASPWIRRTRVRTRRWTRSRTTGRSVAFDCWTCCESTKGDVPAFLRVRTTTRPSHRAQRRTGRKTPHAPSPHECTHLLRARTRTIRRSKGSDAIGRVVGRSEHVATPRDRRRCGWWTTWTMAQRRFHRA